ncbi:uncharacterized protein [Solanum tuberosum]|uniref:uncharacterized protein n=1 Tax=Solanum tuberosum TaxID=4113 RepID=UPI00073A0CBF|nr:PREDICTED: uncharacterized protein LOC107062977 [Solanum tuberosum]
MRKSGWKHQSSNSLDNLVSPLESALHTRSKTRNLVAFSAFISTIEPENIKEALKDADRVNSLQEELHQFERSLQIRQFPQGPSICQEKYINELLRRFNMQEAKIIYTPMIMSNKLGCDEVGIDVNETMYRGIIGSLLYLTVIKPDIVFSMGMCTIFQAAPKESHLKVF